MFNFITYVNIYNMSQITFENNSEELKFIQLELNQLISVYEKTYNIYINKIKNQKDTTIELQKLNEINETIKTLVNRVKGMMPNFKSIEDTNSSIFSQIKGAIETPWNKLNEEKKKVKNISQEVNILVNKNKDEKINNKSVNTKYLITSLFVIIIIFLTIRAFIYLETNNIDIIILVSIIFLIAYQFI